MLSTRLQIRERPRVKREEEEKEKEDGEEEEETRRRRESGEKDDEQEHPDAEEKRRRREPRGGGGVAGNDWQRVVRRCGISNSKSQRTMDKRNGTEPRPFRRSGNRQKSRNTMVGTPSVQGSSPPPPPPPAPFLPSTSLTHSLSFPPSI